MSSLNRSQRLGTGPNDEQWIRHVTHLDLGSGAQPRAGFVGLDKGSYDVDPSREVWQFDLSSGNPWPLADGQVVELYSSHLIEHLPADVVRAHEFVRNGERSTVPGFQRFVREQDALFWFMDECWRVAAPGARFELRWPALVDFRTDPPRWLTTAFMDPTHRRFIPVETLHYFNREMREQLQVTGYAIECDWHVADLGQRELGGGHVENIAWLQKAQAP
jgi:hypothetical protein